MTHACLRLVKLRPVDDHCHLVADDGAPGLDLRGDEARDVLARAAPLFARVLAHRPGVLRALSIDPRARRLLATVAVDGAAKPAVVRVDGDAFDALLATHRELWDELGARYRARRPAT
ncbi:MAG TPA: hypothetical protein RMH99_14645 [Sandaracinaceae bacterium LLY-WYZ-13_1]|nr:hypothetical protein [Sandaracinaceae bacterium LLY-WYZ-13_1]